MLIDDTPPGGHKARRRGRPRLPPRRRRRYAVSVSLTQEEWEFMEFVRGRLTRSAWLRHAAFGDLPAIVPELNREAWHELGRMMVNLNRVVYGLNAGQTNALQGVDIQALSQRVGELRDLLVGDIQAVEAGADDEAEDPSQS